MNPAALNHFEAPQLRPADVRSGAWQRLEVDLERRLAALREDNDAGDAEETTRRRGRIAEIKGLLAFGRALARESQLGEFDR